MKILNLLLIILFLPIKFLYAQLPLNFGSPWRYYVNPTSPQSPPLYGVYDWKSPHFATSGAGWSNLINNAPLGYASGGGSYSGGLAFGTSLHNPSGNMPNASGYYPNTIYYKASITDVNILSYSSFNLELKADDGIVVYFNGAEVYRARMSGSMGSPVSHNDTANGCVGIAGSGCIASTPDLGPINILASSFPVNPTDPNKISISVEIHQFPSATGIPAGYTNSSDSFFDLRLTGGTMGPVTPEITRGPYLQLPHPAGMQIRWRTNTPLVGRVCFGTSSGSLTTCVNDLNSIPANDHIVNLTGLSPNTTYYYSVQHTTGSLTEATINHKFTTPSLGVDNTKTTRIWVTGDASEDVGSASKIPRQDEVLNGFKAFQAANPSSANLDLWLLLGDNAYTIGNETEYSNGFFNPYDDMNTAYAATNNNHIMKQTPLMPCVGNHDYYHDGTSSSNDISSGDQLTLRSVNDFVSPYTTLNAPMNTFYISSTGRAISNFRINKNNPFYDIFSMPDGTNPTGLSSKYSTSNSVSKKGYYSYNHNNIHFICLDSYGFYNNHLLYAGIPTWPALPNPANNPQMAWLMQDLASNTQKWTIMYWHHSPYTRGGGHFSDNLIADEFLLVGIREKLIKYLDDSGHKIDLVLNGHSHSYERSRLLKGHYQTEDSYSTSIHNNNTSANADHNGKFTSSSLECPYIKQTASASNEGIVYVVTGSAGQIQPSSSADIKGHLALNGASFSIPTALDRGTIEESQGGSFYIEIKNNRLDAKFINESGTVADKFTIFKDVNSAVPITKLISPNELPIQTPDLQILPAPTWTSVSSFTISGPTIPTATPFSGASVSVTTPEIGPAYTIKDATGCLSQTYKFLFDGYCWPDVTIKNTIDTPIYQQISSTGRITAKNLIRLGSNVMYRARYAINLNHNGVSGSPLFEIQQSPLIPTRFQSLIIPTILSTCPAIYVPPLSPTE